MQIQVAKKRVHPQFLHQHLHSKAKGAVPLAHHGAEEDAKQMQIWIEGGVELRHGPSACVSRRCGHLHPPSTSQIS
jgi:hypothetical protein